MAGLTGEELRAQAMERIADKPSMVLDGDPIEELALAHERHADRLEVIILSLADVGNTNHLGNTVEGVAATRNIKIAVSDHPGSVVETLRRQAAEAHDIADMLRQNGRALRRTEESNKGDIERSVGEN